MVMAKGVKEELGGKFVMPNMDYKRCQLHVMSIFNEICILYRSEGEGKKEN